MAISRKAVLEKLNGQRVRVTYEGMRTAADNETLRQQILAAMAENGIPADELREDENAFTIGNRFWMKSKLVQGDTGVLTIRSKDYIFRRDRDGENVYGDIPKSADFEPLLDGSGFKKKGMRDGEYIIYTLTA